MAVNIEKQAEQALNLINRIYTEYNKVIVGQQEMIEKMLIALFTGGHILLEGVPGLAKTVAIKTVASIAGLDFSRIQFTPDLLPADILGTQIYNQKTSTFTTRKGPLFSNLVLADEINRAPSKVQSALLEAMQERQITIADKSYTLEQPYMVLATQNPIEQEGTYPLPEAQIDRFMLKINVEYPSKEEEIEIIKRMSVPGLPDIKKMVNKNQIASMHKIINEVYIDEKLFSYIVDIVNASRDPESYGIDKALIRYGASPRASIYLAIAAKAYALMQGDTYVKTDDIKTIAYDVLRHRIIISYEAEAEGIFADDIINKIFEKVETP
ncbi:MAG TPA: MoxR family ATPase [Spirochaetota bacterium]|nr:MoxR family ATPase [Spirochaetota bacterium]